VEAWQSEVAILEARNRKRQDIIDKWQAEVDALMAEWEAKNDVAREEWQYECAQVSQGNARALERYKEAYRERCKQVVQQNQDALAKSVEDHARLSEETLRHNERTMPLLAKRRELGDEMARIQRFVDVIKASPGRTPASECRVVEMSLLDAALEASYPAFLGKAAWEQKENEMFDAGVVEDEGEEDADVDRLVDEDAAPRDLPVAMVQRQNSSRLTAEHAIVESTGRILMVDPQRALSHSEGAASRGEERAHLSDIQPQEAVLRQQNNAQDAKPPPPRPRSAMDQSKLRERPRTAGPTRPRPASAGPPRVPRPESSSRAVARVSSAVDQLLLCRERQHMILQHKSRPGFFSATKSVAVDASRGRVKRNPVALLTE